MLHNNPGCLTRASKIGQPGFINQGRIKRNPKKSCINRVFLREETAVWSQTEEKAVRKRAKQGQGTRNDPGKTSSRAFSRGTSGPREPFLKSTSSLDIFLTEGYKVSCERIT